MNVQIDDSWKQHLQAEFEKPYFQDLADFVRSEYRHKTIYPPPKYIFRAFNQTPFDKVKVVILGQDPYHGPHQANGLSFSVRADIKNPPSLENIYKEIDSDVGNVHDRSGDLTSWANQGVLLLNATLTVQAHQAGSHQKKGWEQFTDTVIQTLSQSRENLVFMLWGSYARKKGEVIDRKRGHLILEAPHPSPLSAHRGFFGCQHFSKANTFLMLHGNEPIQW